MNEDHKKRGLTHSKLLTAVAISPLLLSSGNVMAAQANPDKSLGVTEQLQAITISGLVVDAAGEPIIGASVVEGTTNGGITDLDGKFTLTVTPGATRTLICGLSDTRSEGSQNDENNSERRYRDAG